MSFVNLGKRCPQTWRPLLHRVRVAGPQTRIGVSHPAKTPPRFLARRKDPRSTQVLAETDNRTKARRALDATPEPYLTIEARLQTIEGQLGIRNEHYDASMSAALERAK